MKTFPSFSKIQLADALLFIGASISILWSIYFAMVTISIPYQIEFREGTAQVMTELFLQRMNPFVLENQPLGMNNYGIGYSLVVLPFAYLFGNTLAVHRSVACLFIVLSAALGALAVYKKTKITSLALGCTAFIMIGLMGRGSVGAFPSAMGVFLFLFSVLVPFLRGFDKTSLVFSIFISLIAFYTKAYFVLGFGVVFSYIFLFVSKRKSLFYGLSFLISLFVSANVIRFLFPLYFINTFVGNVSNASMIFQHGLNQLRDLFFIFYPVLGLLIISLSLGLIESKKGFFILKVNALGFDVPLLANPINYFFYLFLCALIAFVFVLGPHTGSYLNYAYQLLVPTFFIWFFQVTSQEKMKYILAVGVLFNLGMWQKDLLNPTMLEQKDSKEWAQLVDYVDLSKAILNSPVVTSAIIDMDSLPMDSGQTTYFYAVEPYDTNFFAPITFDKFQNDGFRYTLSIDRAIEKQRFDLVITTKEKANFYHDKLLPEYYEQVDEIQVDMPQTGQHWTLIIWEPLTK